MIAWLIQMILKGIFGLGWDKNVDVHFNDLEGKWNPRRRQLKENGESNDVGTHNHLNCEACEKDKKCGKKRKKRRRKKKMKKTIATP